MKKAWVITGSAAVVVILAGGGGVWWLTRPAPEAPVNSKGGTISLDDSGGAVSGQSLGAGSGGSGQSTQGVPIGGASGSDGSSKSMQPGQPGLVPTAKELESYASYKDSQQVHFIDYLPGKGVDAKAGDKLVVNYTAWLGDGRKFDDTYLKGQPFVFTPSDNKVISGFSAGVVGMKVGGRRRIIVPPAGGYGAQGKDPVPPNSLLVFDVELVAAQGE